ncbi:hypothetical protein L1987_26741 [Smallanthus sonchifolius]|uniref:Uncharacterized protein n=1 Tax=Smallanthus sonchifolius TaxID=185202 RepID=A0ACB9IAT3_9ASTR|nr:hypothetical protein L1987_26741 [Smallanthus sonchifolius]
MPSETTLDMLGTTMLVQGFLTETYYPRTTILHPHLEMQPFWTLKFLCTPSIVWEDLFLEVPDNSSGFCYVLTTSGNRIEDSISVVWKNSSFTLWVSEESGSWLPSLTDPPPTPVTNGGSFTENSAIGVEDVEEGEFLREQPPVSNPDRQKVRTSVRHPPIN